MKLFIRFTNDIYQDIENGSSKNLFTEESFEGLCAYSFEVMPHEDIEVAGIDRAKELAGWNAQTYADAYDGNFAIFEGDYLGSGLDGVIVRPGRVIYEGNIND